MRSSSLYLLLVLVNIYSSTRALGYGYFWHITDTHVDQNYSRTGNVFNMCHKDTVSFPDNGLYGNYLCDSPQYLVNISIQSMKTLHPNPDFVIWTGDNLPHTEDPDPDWLTTFEAIRNTSQLLSSAFPDTPILPCIGNHDTFPPNLLYPNGPVYKSYLEEGGWDQLLSKETYSTFLNGGFYSYSVKPGLRVVSLNTILWYLVNNFTANLTDPAEQFLWLEDTLRNCSEVSEKVYIIGHVSPGFYNRVIPGEKSTTTYHPQHLESYLKILNKYSEIIIGQLYGHIHMDMFQVYQYNTGTFKGSSLLASSVTPWHFPNKYDVSLPVNPSVRLLKYSQTDFTLLDYDNFYLNLTKVNSIGETTEKGTLYEHLYRFTDVYNVPDLSTESLIRVYETMKSNQSVFDTFFTFLTAGKESVVCDNYCKIAQLCAMSCSSGSEYSLCMQNVPEEYHFRWFLIMLLCGATTGGVLFLFLWHHYMTKRRRNPYQSFSFM